LAVQNRKRDKTPGDRWETKDERVRSALLKNGKGKNSGTKTAGLGTVQKTQG